MPNSKFSGLELATEEPYRLFLVHPVTRQPMRDEEGNPAFVDHYGNDSEIYRKKQLSIQRRRFAMRGRMKITPEELEADVIDTLAALTVGWHLVDLKGNVIDLPFSQDNARELYGNPAVGWLREQIEESSADRANFSQGSSSS